MNNKITPQQALDAVRQLNPEVTHLTLNVPTWVTAFDGMELQFSFYAPNIDWPKGVTQWPPPEPKWTIPTDEDARSRPACRVRDSISDEWLEGGMLVYADESNSRECYEFYTISKYGFPMAWKFCEIKEQ